MKAEFFGLTRVVSLLPLMIKTISKTFLLFICFICFLFSYKAFALEVPPTPKNYVTDTAQMLSPETEARISRALYLHAKQTSNQILLVTFPSLEEESLEDFSIRLAEKWKVGQKGKDNGVILLIFEKERQLRIEVGYGLEGALPDALAGQIINQIIVPEFKKGNFDQGALAGVDAIMKAIGGEFQPSQKKTNQEVNAERQAAMQKAMKELIKIAFVILLILFIIDTLRYFKYAKGHSKYSKRYQFWEWFFRFALVLFVIQLLFRVIFYAMLFSRGGGGGRGGFSGGGGSFGGGGASGSW